jgi:hypothetical protein
MEKAQNYVVVVPSIFRVFQLAFNSGEAILLFYVSLAVMGNQRQWVASRSPASGVCGLPDCLTSMDSVQVPSFLELYGQEEAVTV